MFTGIIEDIGTVTSISPLKDGLEMTVRSEKLTHKLQPGDSISIDGACQTAIRVVQDTFTFQAVGETLTKSTLGQFKPGRRVNLEPSLTLQTPLGGHLLQGHVQGKAKILNWQKRGDNYYLGISIPDQLIKYCVAEGSIAIDGISLTIAELLDQSIGISVIPFTVKKTTLQARQLGDWVNIETDIIARYLEQFLQKSKNEGVSWEKLKDWGY
ncbi:MAG: riboflavin synthase [bacterium]|nr:MAG: riboflavin synthase [bacterium]